MNILQYYLSKKINYDKIASSRKFDNSNLGDTLFGICKKKVLNPLPQGLANKTALKYTTKRIVAGETKTTKVLKE